MERLQTCQGLKVMRQVNSEGYRSRYAPPYKIIQSLEQLSQKNVEIMESGDANCGYIKTLGLIKEAQKKEVVLPPYP